MFEKNKLVITDMKLITFFDLIDSEVVDHEFTTMEENLIYLRSFLCMMTSIKDLTNYILHNPDQKSRTEKDQRIVDVSDDSFVEIKIKKGKKLSIEMCHLGRS